MIMVEYLSNNIKLILSSDSLPIADNLTVLAGEIWQREQRKKYSNLYNGKILSLAGITETDISVFVTDYQFYLAKLMAPKQFRDLMLCAVGVSGVFECADGFVLGKRSAQVTQFPAYWELVPSGAVDVRTMQDTMSIDFRGQLLVELCEEIGLEASQVSLPQVFCSVVDTTANTFDIGMYLKTNLSKDVIYQRYHASKNDEYDSLCMVKEDRLASFFSEHAPQVVEGSRQLIDYYLHCKRGS